VPRRGEGPGAPLVKEVSPLTVTASPPEPSQQVWLSRLPSFGRGPDSPAAPASAQFCGVDGAG